MDGPLNSPGEEGAPKIAPTHTSINPLGEQKARAPGKKKEQHLSWSGLDHFDNIGPGKKLGISLVLSLD